MAIVVFIACHSCHVIIVVSNNCTHRDACALDSLKLERGKADVKQSGRKSTNLIKKNFFTRLNSKLFPVPKKKKKTRYIIIQLFSDLVYIFWSMNKQIKVAIFCMWFRKNRGNQIPKLYTTCHYLYRGGGEGFCLCHDKYLPNPPIRLPPPPIGLLISYQILPFWM